MNACLENCRKHKRKSETPIVKGGDLKTIGAELNKPIITLIFICFLIVVIIIVPIVHLPHLLTVYVKP